MMESFLPLLLIVADAHRPVNRRGIAKITNRLRVRLSGISKSARLVPASEGVEVISEVERTAVRRSLHRMVRRFGCA
jgi:hypothetical protein